LPAFLAVQSAIANNKTMQDKQKEIGVAPLARRGPFKTAQSGGTYGWSLGLVVGVLAGLGGGTGYAQTDYHRILSLGSQGSSPHAAIIEGSDGWLYSTTYGGAVNSGSLFKVRKDGSGFAQIHTFTNSEFPYGSLVELTDGTLASTTSTGGDEHAGTVFKCNKDGSGFVILHSFSAGTGDGTIPVAGLARGTGDVLFGTTQSGGATNLGTVFRVDRDGNGYTILHSFSGATNGADGSFPFSGLCLGLDGLLYGTTHAGGSNDLGTVFKLNPDGTGYSVLHHFNGGPADGREPLGSLVQGDDGRLYGTTYYGGADDSGVIFTLNTNGGGYTTLWSFKIGSDGSQPFAGLVSATNGKLYGTTRWGGSNDGGTIFKVNRDGSQYTVLHNFAVIAGDGSQPLAALMQGSDGAFYGTTGSGGDPADGAHGTVFRLGSGTDRVDITSIVPASGGFLISFAGGVAGNSYQIQAATAPLGPWTGLGSSTAATNGTFQFLDLGCSNIPNRFYRSASQ
jgi:uncharacterized repeat protein (TIGR03803 family)